MRTRDKLIKWGWMTEKGQPLSWKYWWTHWQKNRQKSQKTEYILQQQYRNRPFKEGDEDDD